MNKKKSKLVKNITTGFGGQFVAIILGLIVPRLLIVSYGSDVNGLLGTITQIFTYMALLEAGIGQAARNLLYKPFQEKNEEEISDIVSIARSYFRKCTMVYAIGVIVLAVVLPFLIKTNVDYGTIILIILFEGISGVISFFFIETPSIILTVDGKNYINNGIVLLNKIVTNLTKIIMAAFGMNIVLLQFVNFLITIIKVYIYKYYFKKHYEWIKFKNTKFKGRLQDRNSYVLTEICWIVFSSTDMIILSIFTSTQLASVYSIYNMIFANITLLVNSIYVSVNYLLGYAYNDGVKKYEIMHDAFNSIFIGGMTILMCVCYILTIPFISLYTKGITDVNYIYNQLPIMFCLIQILSWSRYVGGNLTGLAGYAKQTSYVSIIEAVSNLILSIIFIYNWGVIGVTFATMISLLVKVFWCIYISDKKVMKRSYKKSLSIIGINFMFFFCVVFTSKFYKPMIATYGQFIMWGTVLFIVFCFIGIILNILVNKDSLKIVRRYILK